MVLDPLKNAMSITKNVSLNSVASSVNSAEEARRLAQNQLDATQAAAQAKLDDAQAKLDMLAQYKDPEFLKKEAEAKVMALIADKQQELLAQKTEIEKQVAEKITLLLTLYLAFPPKLPAIDVKAAAKKAYAKTKKELQELRQKVSKENLKKGKETFKYPMKPKELAMPTIPELPKLPTIPELPKLPTIPEPPKLPKISQMPKLPTIPMRQIL